MRTSTTLRRLRLLLVPLCGLGVLSSAVAQSTTAAPSASELAKYDRNNNRVLDPEEVAAMQADRDKNARAAAPSSAGSGNDVVALSPFEVVGENIGYMATNTASGTRLNSNLADIASPISVVTKQQLLDTAAVDLNDIFRSEVNVEGLFQYSEIGFDRNQVIDVVSNNPEANNRIRGMGQANITTGGMSTSSVISVNSYNVESVEISRGANSNIFGIGSTSGTVNLNIATGNMSRDASNASVQIDSYGGHRETFDINRVIFRDRLALRVLGQYNDRGFIREPSYDKDTRFTFAARAQPFKYTSLKASYETVRQRQSLPNNLTPREGITSWREFGGYTWDPSNATVYDAAGNPVRAYTGVRAPTTGPFAGFGGNALATTYRFQGGSGASDYQRPMIGYIDGQIAYWTSTSSWVWASRNATTLGNTYNQTGDQRIVDYQLPAPQIYVGEINPATGQPFGVIASAFNEQLIAVHGAEGKAIYDWEKYNINASNKATKAADVARFELEQNVFTTPRQQLAFQAGALLEKIDNKSWNFIGNGGDGVQGIVYIDPNRKLPDGSPNPGYLRPYIRARQPQRYDRPEDNRTYKSQVAYLLDLSRNENWTKWFGRHNFLGYGEDRERRFAPNALRFKSQLVNTVDGIDRHVGNADSLNTRYYLGDATGFNIDSPTTSPPTIGTFPYTYWSTEFGNTGSTRFDDPKFRTTNARLEEIYFSQNMQKTEIRTVGGIWQGFLLDGRIIPTVGWRKDKIRFAPGKPFSALNPESVYTVPGYPSSVFIDPYPTAFDFSDTYIVTNPRTGADVKTGQTRTQGIVLKPLSWLALTYNRSASFEPAGLAIDTYGNIVENPTGKDESYGVRFNFLDDRLWVSLNKYEATTINARNGGANVVAGRAIPFDVDTADSDPDASFGGITSGNQKDLFDWYFYRIFGNTSTTAGNNTALEPGWQGTGDIAYMRAKGLLGASNLETLQRVTDHVFELMQYDKDIVRRRFNAPGATNTATNDVTSEGYELEVLYRTKNWNLKVTGAQKETIDSNIAGSLTQYISERRPILEAARYTNMTTGITESYWNGTFDSSGSTHGNSYFSEVYSVYNPLVANLGKPRPQVRKYSMALTTSYNLAGITEHKYLKRVRVGGGVNWASRGSIGYRYKVPTADPVTGTYTITELDPSRPIFDKARYSASAWASYDFTMFSGRVKSALQLNVQNLLEDGGRLQPVSARTDGQTWAYRIIDPRMFQLTLRMDL